ncbi:MAG: two-component system response regulator CreB [Gammaproteobacteria bacterium]|nr:two-component system response regulator CreB [Gammaproteobacteria bacterium]
MPAHILLLEDEESIADALIYSLKAEGFQVTWCQLVQEAIVHSANVDLLILDVGLPDGNGFEFCKQIRRQSEVPVIFLTARASEIDRVVGLEIGADDYVVKPFSPRELVARVKAILKRTQRQLAAVTEQSMTAEPTQTQSQATADQPIKAQQITAQQIGDFLLKPTAVQILLKNKLLTLTALEYRLLSHFLAHPQQVLSREQLLQSCGQSADAGYDRNIDTHIKSLRAKFRICSELNYLITQRGFGYSLNPQGQTT